MSALDDLKADLAKLRDEAKVQVHLGTMETKQEWEEIEAKWNRIVAEAGLHKSGEGIKAALQSLGNELRAAYQRLKIGRASCRERVCQSCRSRWSPYH